MPRAACIGDFKPTIRALLRQGHAGQAQQAGAILQPFGPPMRAHQRQPMQRRTAAGFQIRLIPHGPGFPFRRLAAPFFWGGRACSSSFQHKAKQHVHAD